ncbi:MAG: type II secretion system protein GspL, partial [Pacificimonas sp.]
MPDATVRAAVRADISPRRASGPGADTPDIVLLPDGLVLDDVGPQPRILVPSEHVLLLPVDLPLPGARQRAEALPFALEAQLGAPIETMHIAMGEALGGVRYLGAAVRLDLMRRWTTMLADMQGDEAALPLVPDATTLPIPALGWLVRRAGN